MKAFVTGGSGLIGQHLIRQLLARGTAVTALAHTGLAAELLHALGAQVARGHIGDIDSMRERMRGSDVVYHLGGWNKPSASDWMNAEALNVAGTRNVLGLAHELGIAKIVYSSTATVLGDTKGWLVDETHYQGGPFRDEYHRTKWLAHYKVALPMIERGAPLVIVMPGGFYGPGDEGVVGRLMAMFYQGRWPIVTGTNFVQTYAHVEDIAEGHILAADKGLVGESYILAGPAIPLGEMFDFWAQLLGRPVPALRIPAGVLLPFAPLIGALSDHFSWPDPISRYGVSLLGNSYMVSAEKARAELGWRTRSLQDGMSETFRWIAETRQPIVGRPIQNRQMAGVALLVTAAVLLLWFLGRRR
jgi:nucleoside-diphosphate-sugar epimerase